MITDVNNRSASARADSDVPVMWDNYGGGTPERSAPGGPANVSNLSFYNHVPGGANVLYVDGHVEFKRDSS